MTKVTSEIEETLEGSKNYLNRKKLSASNQLGYASQPTKCPPDTNVRIMRNQTSKIL